MTASAPPQIVAGRYELLREITRGGMGAVWVAHDRSLEREVAVKLILPAAGDQDAARVRFQREARAVAALASQHVVQIFDFGLDGGSPFLVMELLHGEDLGAHLKRVERVPITAAQAICAQIAKALEAAHDAGVIHRDLKPANVFLARMDGGEVVKILDFGIAKAHGALTEGELTRTGAILGTPHYMSPEQLRSARSVDHRSDLWSLAVMLFQCVTGTRPFSSETFTDLIFAINVDPVPVPSQIRPGLHGDVDAFFARALEREPGSRFQSASEMAGAFSKLSAVDDGGRARRSAELCPQTPVDAHVAHVVDPREATRDLLGHEDTRRARAERDTAVTAATVNAAGAEEEIVAWVEWDEAEGVATVLLKPGAVGRTAESIAAWKRQVSAGLARFGRKVPLLVCVDGGVISPSLAAEYGAAAKEIIDRYATSFARYGTASGLRMISAVESMKRAYRPNLFDDRASALAFLRSDRSAPGTVK